MRPHDRSRFVHADQGDRHEGVANEERGKHDAASGGQALPLIETRVGSLAKKIVDARLY
jgi:hypothetical protein